MRQLRMIAAGAILCLSGPALGQKPVVAPADYAAPANWLCLPGRADACANPLPTVALNANGYGSVGRSVPAENPPFDCFYVYPTISRDAGMNSDLTPGIEEQAAAATQFARFATLCKTYAPMYRQVTLAGLASTFSGGAGGDLGMAYEDVLAAWRYYLANNNQGRPFVLIGHSQGTVHLNRLMAEEIEGGETAKRMLSAILLGWAVEVPEGNVVGGTFKETPLCTERGQTGCVISFMTFRATNPPPASSLLGRAARPGMTAACTNPASLSNRTARLDSYWFTAAPAQAGVVPVQWSSEGAPPTPFVRTEGLATAACVNRGRVGYLSVLESDDPADIRTNRIPGDVYVAGALLAGWGLHVADMSIAQGDLISLVEAQAKAFAARR